MYCLSNKNFPPRKTRAMAYRVSQTLYPSSRSADASRSRSPRPRSPQGPPPTALLKEKDNRVSFTINTTIQPVGSIHDTLKRIGAQLIAKAETGDFSAATTDRRLQTQFSLNNATFIGGQIIKLESQNTSLESAAATMSSIAASRGSREEDIPI